MELVNALPLLVSAPLALAALVMFVIAVAGAGIVTRAFFPPERDHNGRQYFD